MLEDMLMIYKSTTPPVDATVNPGPHAGTLLSSYDFQTLTALPTFRTSQSLIGVGSGNTVTGPAGSLLANKLEKGGLTFARQDMSTVTGAAGGVFYFPGEIPNQCVVTLAIALNIEGAPESATANNNAHLGIHFGSATQTNRIGTRWIVSKRQIVQTVQNLATGGTDTYTTSASPGGIVKIRIEKASANVKVYVNDTLVVTGPSVNSIYTAFGLWFGQNSDSVNPIAQKGLVYNTNVYAYV